MAAAIKSRVFETASAAQAREQRRTGPPEHWANSEGTKFKNPYPSWRPHDSKDFYYMVFQHAPNHPTVPENIAELIPVHKPDWDRALAGKSDKVKATWLGHSSFLVTFPSRSAHDASRGINVLFDPIFSERCSPVQWIGPKRFTPAPCQVNDLPEVDAVHDHYDHLDANTIKALYKRSYLPHIFTPPGYDSLLHSFGVPKSHRHELDWWDTLRLELEVPAKEPSGSAPSAKLIVDITATPSQHNTSRTISDRFFDFKRLWASWVVEEVLESTDSSTHSPAKKVFFGGDTGYRAVLDDQDEDTVPTFPGFKQIGEHFGEIDLALIPIGAYEGRRFMSPDHCAPQDSVLIFKDVRAKQALAMHWGTFILTIEDIMDPPKVLEKECKKVGIPDGAFVKCDIGETRAY
ncbi:hypothetical protein HGRIS_014245 [Hohenbuehelia grisea]|uniref:Metallo-beta-lactamase domain-containing protein n=1 Tax=Hohenbuehelia grisea TaxID=104357 RepID=A0ABR3JTF7_9AGAR